MEISRQQKEYELASKLYIIIVTNQLLRAEPGFNAFCENINMPKTAECQFKHSIELLQRLERMRLYTDRSYQQETEIAIHIKHKCTVLFCTNTISSLTNMVAAKLMFFFSQAHEMRTYY